MVAEMEPSARDGSQDLLRFWEEIPSMQRLQCHVLQDVNSAFRLTTNNYNTPPPTSDHQRIHATLQQLMTCSSRLEQKLDQCLWIQRFFIVLVILLTALWGITLYIHYSVGYSKGTTATY